MEPKLTVGTFWSPDGDDVTEAIRTTLPVKLVAATTITVAVSPELAPRLTETVVPLTVKVGTAVTVTEPLPVDALYLLSPVYLALRVLVPIGGSSRTHLPSVQA